MVQKEDQVLQMIFSLNVWLSLELKDFPLSGSVKVLFQAIS